MDMKITARGWRRDSGPKTICDYEVKDAEPDSEKSWNPDVPYLRRTASAVELRIGPATLNLGGEYQLMLRLTDEDIIRLFFEIQPELRDSLRRVFVNERPSLGPLVPLGPLVRLSDLSETAERGKP
jgi:hypothetical protein